VIDGVPGLQLINASLAPLALQGRDGAGGGGGTRQAGSLPGSPFYLRLNCHFAQQFAVTDWVLLVNEALYCRPVTFWLGVSLWVAVGCRATHSSNSKMRPPRRPRGSMLPACLPVP